MAGLNLGGALGGAVSGGYAGSTFGPIGTAVGGVLGGLGGLFGKKKKPKKKSTFDPLQKKLYEDKIASLRGQGPFSNLYNFDANQANDVFNQTVAKPAYKGFQENIVPGITGQYRSNNLLNSSYSGEALSRAGRDVQEALDAQRAAYQFQGQQNAQQNKMNAINDVLGMSTFTRPMPQQSAGSPIDQILGSLAPKAGDWLQNYLNNKGAPKPISATAPSIAAAGIRTTNPGYFGPTLFGPRTR